MGLVYLDLLLDLRFGMHDCRDAFDLDGDLHVVLLEVLQRLRQEINLLLDFLRGEPRWIGEVERIVSHVTIKIRISCRKAARVLGGPPSYSGIIVALPKANQTGL